ncbi:MAG: hemin uptake protein HemP [Pseudomonadota bacterium]
MTAQLNSLHKAQPRHWKGAAPIDRARAEPQGRVLDSAHILAGQREVIIEHEGVVYRLRHTKNGKLILTK